MPQRAVEPFDMMRPAGQRGDRTVLGGGNDPQGSGSVSRVEHRVLVIHSRALLPYSCCTLATAITDSVREGVRILSAYTLKSGVKV